MPNVARLKNSSGVRGAPFVRPSSAAMVLTAAKRAKLRAERALKAGDTTFRPRGTTNKKAFEELKEQMRTYDLERKAGLDRQTQDLKDHISNECKSLAALIGTQFVTPPSQQESDSSL